MSGDVRFQGGYTRDGGLYVFRDDAVIARRRGSVVAVGQGSVEIVADVTGLDKLYFAIDGGSLVVSDVFRDFVGRPIDRRLEAILRWNGFVPYPLTILEGVRKAPPGVKVGLHLSPSGWEVSYQPSPALEVFNRGRFSRADFRDELVSRVTAGAPEELVSSFSGGFDSTLLTLLLRDRCRVILHFEVGGERPVSTEGLPDCPWMLLDEEIPFHDGDTAAFFRSWDEPAFDTAAFAEFLMARRVAASMPERPIMNGQAVDALFQGSRHYLQEFVANALGYPLGRHLPGGTAGRFARYLVDTRTRFRTWAPEVEAECARVLDVYRRGIDNDAPNILAALRFALLSPLHSNEKLKGAARGAGVTYFLPFLHEDVIRLAFSVPSRLKLGLRLGKRILRKAFPEVAAPSASFQPTRLKERLLGQAFSRAAYFDFATARWIASLEPSRAPEGGTAAP